jgi:hypothetical protein
MALSGKKDWNCAAAVTCRLFVSWSFQGPVKVPRCRVLKRSKQAQQGSAHTTTTTTTTTATIVRHLHCNQTMIRIFLALALKRPKSSSTFPYLTLKDQTQNGEIEIVEEMEAKERKKNARFEYTIVRAHFR